MDGSGRAAYSSLTMNSAGSSRGSLSKLNHLASCSLLDVIFCCLRSKRIEWRWSDIAQHKHLWQSLFIS